jgi:hypothetical protein
MSEEGRESIRDAPPSPQTVSALAAILRMDLKGSRDAAHRDFEAFKGYMALLRRQVNKQSYPSLIGENEGEGDSIRRAFTDIRDALKCAFHLRHAAQQPVEAKDGLYTLTPRVVLHLDEFTTSEEGRIESLGQILVTDLDHAVPLGEILATEAFVKVARQIDAGKVYSFQYLGPRKLDKSPGRHPCFTVGLASDGTSSTAFPGYYNQLELAVELLNQGDESSQASAVEVLGYIESESASHKLIEVALDLDIDRRVRDSAFVKLQQRGDDINDADIDKLKAVFEQGTLPVETRALLLFVLGATRREDIFPALSNVVKMDPPAAIRLREAAMLALRNFRGKLINGTVGYALGDEEEDEVRVAACVAACRRLPIKSEVHKKLLEIITNGGLPIDLRNVASEALAAQQMTDDLRGKLMVILDSDYPLTLRRYALNKLAQSGDPIAMRMVEDIARRRGDDLRVDAMIARAMVQPVHLRPYRPLQEPESHVANVIELRTRPQRQGA